MKVRKSIAARSKWCGRPAYGRRGYEVSERDADIDYALAAVAESVMVGLLVVLAAGLGAAWLLRAKFGTGLSRYTS
jgi:hypothetical protein